MAIVWVLDCTHVALCIQAVHHCIIARHRNPVALSILIRSIIMQANINGLVATAAQVLFAPKTPRWSTSWGMITIIMLLSLGTLSISLSLTMKS